MMDSDFDPVSNPRHYKRVAECPGCGCEIEAIDITEGQGFVLGNALKYILRAGRKGDAVEDLRKAMWYLDREIKRLSK